MERRQIVLIVIIVLLGLGSYLALMIFAVNSEKSFCGQYRLQLQDNYYQDCLQETKSALVCESDAADRAWGEIQGLAESECQEKLE